jgi:hypothetical protein
MSRGQLKKANASIVATHFLALLTHGEVLQHYFVRELPAITRTQIKRIVERALDAFLEGYRPS